MLSICCTKSALKSKFFSDAIIWWARYKFGQDVVDMSHICGKFMGSSWNRDFVYQSSGHATNFIGETLFKKKHIVVEEYILNIPKELEIEIGQVCVDREGKPYAIKQTIGIAISALVYILTFRKIEIDNPFADGDKETNCLEEWCMILSQKMNVEPPPKADQITPWEFRCWLRQQPFVRQR